MHNMTRRALLLCSSLAVFLAVAPVAGAVDVKPGGITVRPDGRICEREARLRIEAILQKMISAAEKRAPGQLSYTEKAVFVNKGWKSTREILAQHYAFTD